MKQPNSSGTSFVNYKKSHFKDKTRSETKESKSITSITDANLRSRTLGKKQNGVKLVMNGKKTKYIRSKLKKFVAKCRKKENTFRKVKNMNEKLL